MLREDTGWRKRWKSSCFSRREEFVLHLGHETHQTVLVWSVNQHRFTHKTTVMSSFHSPIIEWDLPTGVLRFHHSIDSAHFRPIYCNDRGLDPTELMCFDRNFLIVSVASISRSRRVYYLAGWPINQSLYFTKVSSKMHSLISHNF